MTRLSVSVILAFLVGCVATSTFSGCSKPADRTLTLYQLLSTRTYDGQFLIDTSQLPSDAIEQSVDIGDAGELSKRITLKRDYEIEIVLKLVGGRSADGSTSHTMLGHAETK